MTHTSFTGLRDIGAVERYSPEHDSKCFFDLAAVLDQHEKSNGFLITLLHTHFPVDNDEAVVEQIDTSKREVVKKVFQEETVRSDAMPCVNWRLTERGLLPIEFTASSELYDQPALTDTDHPCLGQLGSVLAQYNALTRFGVAL